MATDNPGIKSWLHVKLLELNGGLRYSTGKSKKKPCLLYDLYLQKDPSRGRLSLRDLFLTLGQLGGRQLLRLFQGAQLSRQRVFLGTGEGRFFSFSGDVVIRWMCWKMLEDIINPHVVPRSSSICQKYSTKYDVNNVGWWKTGGAVPQ